MNKTVTKPATRVTQSVSNFASCVPNFVLNSLHSVHHIIGNNADNFEVIDVCDSVYTTESTETSLNVCVCKKSFSNDHGMLKCVPVDCPFGRYFHKLCLGYRRIPKSNNWLCFRCRKEEAKKSGITFHNSIIMILVMTFALT